MSGELPAPEPKKLITGADVPTGDGTPLVTEGQKSLSQLAAFKTHYEMPNDQFSAELALVEKIKSQHPDYEAVLHSNLDDIKRFSGINVPKYKAVDPSRQDSSIIDEHGYIKFQPGKGWSKLWLQPPKEISKEEYEALSDTDKDKFDMEREGVLILGELPEPTMAMLDGMYALTGAEVVRDDRTEAHPYGDVIRKGEYQGTPVYFVESHEKDVSGLSELTQHGVRIVGEDTIKIDFQSLNNTQFDEFVETSGLRPHQARKMIVDGDVTRANYQAAADSLRQAGEVMNSLPPNGPSVTEQ